MVTDNEKEMETKDESDIMRVMKKSWKMIFGMEMK